MEELEDVLECHHVTGGPTLLLKVKTRNTQSLERLISALRALPDVERTETNVVLATLAERPGLGTKSFRAGGNTEPPPRDGGNEREVSGAA
jgi:DNA-binding Lrp family transcriptional regulator